MLGGNQCKFKQYGLYFEKISRVEHRLELVDMIQGVRFINDSKGTNPDAAVKALEAVSEPIILIAGVWIKGRF